MRDIETAARKYVAARRARSCQGDCDRDQGTCAQCYAEGAAYWDLAKAVDARPTVDDLKADAHARRN